MSLNCRFDCFFFVVKITHYLQKIAIFSSEDVVDSYLFIHMDRMLNTATEFDSLQLKSVYKTLYEIGCKVYLNCF